MPANPVLTPERFQRESDVNRPGWGAPTGTVTGGTAPGGAGSGGGTPGAATWPEAASAPVERSQAMTIAGTLTATGVLFALILAAGAFGWGQVTQTTQYVDSATGQVVTGPGPGVVVENTTSIPGWMIVSVLVGVGLAFLTAFKPKLARITAPLYAIAYGVALGAISAVYNNSFDGIVVQAVLATLGVFLAMFFLYATRIIKVTPKYVAIVVAATFGIIAVYLVGFVASLFGTDLVFWDQPSFFGIAFSVVVVGVAAAYLAIDFDFIERASSAGVPKYMEWYGAFGVTVTIVWLYLSILRLLALLRSN
jgi:uncharacterized YccA/Bax inhibitor family protein